MAPKTVLISAQINRDNLPGIMFTLDSVVQTTQQVLTHAMRGYEPKVHETGIEHILCFLEREIALNDQERLFAAPEDHTHIDTHQFLIKMAVLTLRQAYHIPDHLTFANVFNDSEEKE